MKAGIDPQQTTSNTQPLNLSSARKVKLAGFQKQNRTETEDNIQYDVYVSGSNTLWIEQNSIEII